MNKIVKSVIQLGDGWSNNRGGTSYSQWVEFEDGYAGLATSQSPTPPYQAGTAVIVDETEYKTKKGAPKIKVKVDKDSQVGSTMPQATQSPSAGSQTPSNGFPDDKEAKIRNGMICNMMSRLVAAGKSVSDAHSLASQILAAVEGNDGHPELEKSNRGPQPAYPESEGGMPDGSECPF